MTEMNELYRLRVRRLGLLLSPRWLRRGLAMALLYAGLTPLERIAGEVRREREAAILEIGRTGQRGRLRGLLNDAFDPESRRIRVYDTTAAEAWTQRLVRHRGEDPGVMVLSRGTGGIVLGRRSSSQRGHWGRDFVVSVPAELSGLAADGRLRGLVNKYKLPGTRWDVEVES